MHHLLSVCTLWSTSIPTNRVDYLRFAAVKFSPTPLKLLQRASIVMTIRFNAQQSSPIDSHQHAPFLRVRLVSRFGNIIILSRRAILMNMLPIPLFVVLLLETKVGVLVRAENGFSPTIPFKFPFILLNREILCWSK
jgi:hypothetical protein